MIVARGKWASPEDAPRLRIYADSEGRPMLRAARYAAGQPSVVFFRVLLSVAWGAPKHDDDVACHMACDNCMCLNPAHGRFGTRKQNGQEAFRLRAWRHIWRQATLAIRDMHPSNPGRYWLGIQRFPNIQEA